MQLCANASDFFLASARHSLSRKSLFYSVEKLPSGIASSSSSSKVIKKLLKFLKLNESQNPIVLINVYDSYSSFLAHPYAMVPSIINEIRIINEESNKIMGKHWKCTLCHSLFFCYLITSRYRQIFKSSHEFCIDFLTIFLRIKICVASFTPTNS